MLIDYQYLFRHEHDSGLDEGKKVRPCLVMNVTPTSYVVIVPLTTSPKFEAGVYVPVDPKLLLHAGVAPSKKGKQSFAKVSEVNLCPIKDWHSGLDLHATYGMLAPSEYEPIKTAWIKSYNEGILLTVNRKYVFE